MGQDSMMKGRATMTESTEQETAEQDHVLADVVDGLGLLTLNRPHQINALTRPMVTELTRRLGAWREDPSVGIVVLRGAGDRGFCAGGDILAFHTAITTGKQHEFLSFLAEEFQLDGLIATYPKPVVALMEGLCMGGGVGLAGHASVRIVTPRSAIGMPETHIGYSPDVGGTHLLGLAPGRLGEHLALTASTMGAADAIHAGFADFFIADDGVDDVLAALPDLVGLPPADVAVALEILLGTRAPAGQLASDAAWIDEAYAGEDVPGILQRLDASAFPAAAQAAAAIRANSPLATQTALQAVRAAREDAHLPSALARELRVADFLMRHPDLPEGIRAQIIDKDRTPHWSPSDHQEVDPQQIAAAIASA
ncbi:enoyl-CoA hydratase/isomerase family protein [Arthrobacter sp.]|uniref:enoyl-CoA hydratase/isomerase family protein n=1 Tax=Arthrobacter sp. TaxID=1667 RepID=UPI003A9425F7